MKKSEFKTLALSWLAAAALAANATNTDDVLADRDPRNAAVTVGRWHADLNKARAYAEENGLPLIAVWSNGDYCAHCLAFEGAVASPAFKSWMKTSGIVFYFGAVNDGSYNYNGGTGPSSDGQEGYHGTSFYWCCKGNNRTMGWPYVRIYWPKGGVDICYEGATIDGEGRLLNAFPCSNTSNETKPAQFIYPGDHKTYNPAGRRSINFLVGASFDSTGAVVPYAKAPGGVLAGFSPVPPYTGGDFGVVYADGYPDAVLQVERDTQLTELTIPLVRKDEMVQAREGFNYLLSIFPNGTVVTSSVDWVVGEASKDFKVAFNKSWLVGDGKAKVLGLAGDASAVTLGTYNRSGELQASNRVICVDRVENSPKNPLWIGERTSSTLNPGEWTMDLDAATNAVKKWGGDAYTLVLVGGSLWCPDCVRTDKYLLDTEEFKAWTTNGHKIACVAIDIPNMKAGISDETTSPCLLTRLQAKAGDGYVNEIGKGESARYQSGTAYLSRKGISSADATKCLNRNKALAAGKFNKPGSTSLRPGVPTCYILRGDGSIAGRISQFANSSTPLVGKPVSVVLQRFDELIAQTEDAGEELNDSHLFTKSTLARRELAGKSATLSFSDQADYYKLEAEKYTTVYLSVKATEGFETESQRIILSIIDADLENPEATPVLVETNALNRGILDVSCELPSDNCYVKVSYPVNGSGYPLDGYYALDKNGSTLGHYTITSDSLVYASETMTLWEIADCASGCADLGDGVTNVWITLAKGEDYKFTGLAAVSAENDAALEYDAEKGTYRAKVSGGTKLALAVGDDGKVVFGYQRWKPGTVGFYPTVQKVKEAGDGKEDSFVYNIAVRRSDGLSGWSAVKVSLDTDETTKLDVYEWGGDVTLVWGEGTNSVQTVPVTVKADKDADNMKKLVFKLTEVREDDERTYTTGILVDDTSRFTLMIEDDDAAVPGYASLDGVQYEGDAGPQPIPASRTVVVKGGAQGFKIVAERVDGTDGDMVVDVTVAGNTAGQIRWDGRDGGAKEFEIAVPAYKKGGANKAVVALKGVDGSVIAAGGKYLTLTIVPATAVEFDEGTFRATLNRYVMSDGYELALNDSTFSSAESEISVRKISGTLPPGMSWVFDPESGDGGAVVISGTPTRAGNYSAIFQAFEDGVAGGTTVASFTVNDPASASGSSEAKNPYLETTRTISDAMVVDESEKRLVGLLTVTIPRSGRLSGKYRSVSGAVVPMLATGWSGCTEAGDYTATMEGVLDPSYSAEVTAKADGSVEITFSDPDFETATCLPRGSAWSVDNPASEWEGYYTASLPIASDEDKALAFASGDAYMTLRMESAASVSEGKMLYAGVLPSGAAYSGSATLEKSSAKVAMLPVFCLSSRDSVTGVFNIDRGAVNAVSPSDDARPYWTHDETLKEASYAARLNSFGCLYDREYIHCGCTNALGTTYTLFFVLADRLVDNEKFGIRCGDGFPLEWATNNIYAIGLDVSGDNHIKVYDPVTAAKSNGLTFSFSRDTGIVTGSCYLDFYESKNPVRGTRVTATYRGVVLPGWGKHPLAECGSCSDEGDSTVHPFISGTCLFSDTFEYDSKWGARHLQIKRSCPFSVGLTPGE